MKRIKYPIYQSTRENSEVITAPKSLPWSKANWEIAKAESYGAEPEIFDDGNPEPVAEPTDKERLEALEAAMLEMMGVTIDD